VGDHVSDYGSDVLIGRHVKHLFAMPLGAHHAGCTKEAQMMADEGRGESRPQRYIRNASRGVQARENDFQAACVAHKPKYLSEFNYLIVGN